MGRAQGIRSPSSRSPLPPSKETPLTSRRRSGPETIAEGPDILSPPIRCQLRGKVDEATERFALRAVLTAARLFGLAAGTHLRQLRNLNDPLVCMQARLEEAQLHARLAWEIVDILSARFRKIPEKRRPHYSPAQRFRALEIRSLRLLRRHPQRPLAPSVLATPTTCGCWI